MKRFGINKNIKKKKKSCVQRIKTQAFVEHSAIGSHISGYTQAALTLLVKLVWALGSLHISIALV